MLQPSLLLCPSNTLLHSYLLVLALVVDPVCLHFSPNGCVESALISFRPLHKCQLLQKALSDPCKRHSLHHISGLSLAFTLFHCCYDFCYFIFFGVFPDIWNILLFLLMGLLPTCIRIQLDNNEVSLSFLCYLQYLEQCLTQGIGAEVIVWLWSWMD